MSHSAGKESGALRTAVPDDIPVLARHHRRMFEEILDTSGMPPVSPEVLDLLEREYSAKLARDLLAGRCTAWIIAEGDRIVSSGAVSDISYVPVPQDPSCCISFLHSIYTEPVSRHKQYARRITDTAAEHCRSRGIRRLYLFASDAGRPLYEKAGFISVPNMMILLQ